MSSNNYRQNDRNRNARIETRSRANTLYARTSHTKNRDSDSMSAIINTESNNTTQFLVARNGVTVQLNGHEARTLFRLLEKHYYG